MINIGVIGAGRIGRIHAQSIQEKVQGAQVKTIADVFEESAKKLLRNLKFQTIQEITWKS